MQYWKCLLFKHLTENWALKLSLDFYCAHIYWLSQIALHTYTNVFWHFSNVVLSNVYLKTWNDRLTHFPGDTYHFHRVAPGTARAARLWYHTREEEEGHYASAPWPQPVQLSHSLIQRCYKQQTLRVFVYFPTDKTFTTDEIQRKQNWQKILTGFQTQENLFQFLGWNQYFRSCMEQHENEHLGKAQGHLACTVFTGLWVALLKFQGIKVASNCCLPLATWLIFGSDPYLCDLISISCWTQQRLQMV